MSWFDHAGQRIWFEDEGSGDPVLVLPGWTERFDDLNPLIAALRRDHRVIAADLPGSGRSLPQPRAYPATYYDDDALSFLALLAAIGASPAHLVGFSDGGEVALLMGVRGGPAIRSIAAWGAAGEIAVPASLIDVFHDVIDKPADGLAEFSGHLKAAYGEANARLMTQSATDAWRAIVAAGGDISRKSAGAIGCPALLITGSRDFFAPPEVVSRLARAIPGGEFVAAEDAGHLLHVERGGWLIETIVGWLARHGTRR
jgi:valacyclovir hydrolase